MSEISIIVKPTAGGQKFSITGITGATTIAELKEKVQEKTDIAPAEQRLIFKGQVLKDERDVASYGVEHDNVMHLVKSRPAASGSTGAGSGGSAANGQPAAAPAASAAVSPPAFGNMGLFANQAGTGQGMEEQMAAIMNSPVMQSMLDNPELLRTMLQANPGIQQVMNSNPEFAQLLNNPEMLRESLRMATNPALMREQMRSNDRALSNIESHPEGYNHLRRLYENVQAPLMEAADSAATGPAAANPFASLFQAPTAAAPPPATGASPAASHAPNTAPLPNPWAPAAAGAASAGGGAPPAGAECMGMFGAGLPGLGRAGGGTPPNVDGMMQAIQNPAMQQVMQQLVAQPGFMEAMMNSNPQMRAMAESSPEVRAMLQNPEAMRQMMNPETMQAMVNMQRAMQQLQGSGAADLFGGLPAGGPQPGGAPGAGAPDLSGLMGMLNTGGFGGVPAAPPVANPEEAYAMQIQQLVDMGFYDRDANVRALTATAGNVNAAVERLLQS